MGVPAGAACSVHSAASAVEVCERCGTFLCGACLNFANETPLCENCHRLRVRVKPSGRAIAALLLGIVGLHCLFPLGIVGWVLATQERVLIDAGRSPSSGASLTVAAKVLGIINLGLLVIAALTVAVLVSQR